MIKDNHADAIGGVRSAIEEARRKRPDLTIAAEARTVAEARAAAEAGADIVMLDNMTAGQIRQSVKAVAGRAQTEATGSVSVHNIAALARTGVGRISVGALTHSAPALDFSMLLL
jgi:nicotinate-nucleotide pyrophosphorylase (carboxylating)